jgi:hypothetical protein
MPTDSCLFYSECEQCKTLLRVPREYSSEYTLLPFSEGPEISLLPHRAKKLDRGHRIGLCHCAGQTGLMNQMRLYDPVYDSKNPTQLFVGETPAVIVRARASCRENSGHTARRGFGQ